jgi:septal ring factor EnvC (AmiA/AmiB activator)
MRHWSWILTAMAILALVVLVFPLVHTQKRLRTLQHELGRADEQVVQARAATTELERVITNLKAELDAANKSRTQLQTTVTESN